jgi:CPA1 family monovalent cation:H+ antiporter
MRGVVTVAAAQSLPSDIPHRSELVLIAFIVAIVTLLGHGATLPPLIKALGIVGTDSAEDRQELARLVDRISSMGLAALDEPGLAQRSGAPYEPDVIDRVRADSRLISESLAEEAESEATEPDEAEPPGFSALEDADDAADERREEEGAEEAASPDEGTGERGTVERAMVEPHATRPAPASAGPHQQHRALRLRVLRAERAALLEARSTGAYSSRVMERAQHMLDLEESRLAQLNDDPF